MKTDCIVCPRGCRLTLIQKDGGEREVLGAGCSRGVAYGMEEMTAPRRVLTTTLPVTGGTAARVSLRSESAVPKELLFDVLRSLRERTVPAPVEPGQLIIQNAGGLGVNLIATSRAERKEE